jgi:formyltetrahydrofolate deformylase
MSVICVVMIPGVSPARPDEVVRLVVSCDDRPGIVAAVSRALFESGANIVTSDQWSSDRFHLRMTFTGGDLDELRDRFERDVAQPFGMRWRLHPAAQRPRVALMASHEDHCLVDLLWRVQRGELPVDLVGVVSNHRVVEPAVAAAGVPFHHVPVPPGGKAEAEARQLELLAGRCDLVVLARYMQVLSGRFLQELGCPVINIHHSFLPAFAGAGPYERAHERGVKLIGATAHYVTEELDAGPIIDQDVERVDHRAGVEDLVRVGRDIERRVLARAVALHVDDRVVVDGPRTIVF